MQDPESAQRLEQNKTGLFTSDLSVAEFLLLDELGYRPLGLVMGSCVYQVGFQSAPWRESLELTAITQAMYTARHLAMSRMTEEARYLGAAGVVGMRLDIGGQHLGLGNGVLEFMAVGTAVAAPQDEEHTLDPFTSNLSGQEFYKLHRGGFRPVGLTVGNCVYHVAYQGGSVYARGHSNEEMTHYTIAIYHARELAMDRMQAEGIRDRAIGIVGTRISEHTRGWDKQVFEFLAMGTSIRRATNSSTTSLRPEPSMVLSLDE